MDRPTQPDGTGKGARYPAVVTYEKIAPCSADEPVQTGDVKTNTHDGSANVRLRVDVLWVAWSGVTMVALLTSLVAVAGTLLGAAASYVIQQCAAERSECFQRAERLRQERLNAVKELATALHDYRRGQGERWHTAHREWDGPEAVTARMESYRLRTVVWNDLSRSILLFGDTPLVHGARSAFEIAGEMHHAADADDLERRDSQVRLAIDASLEAAAPHVR